MLQAEEDLLVLAAQDGDHSAFEYLHKKYHKPLLRYAFKVCQNQEIAQDAVQNSWLKLAKNIRKLKDPRVFRELRYAINRLPSIEKQMIHLFYLEELKISEISMILGIPVGTVKSRLNRARKQLKQKFELQ